MWQIVSPAILHDSLFIVITSSSPSMHPLRKIFKAIGALTTRSNREDGDTTTSAAGLGRFPGTLGSPTKDALAATATERPEGQLPSCSSPSHLPEDSNIGLKVLVSQPADRSQCIDIIALHGLNGHRDTTWTDRVTGLNWLSNESCLPKDIPNARILTFGYNSKTYFSRSRSTVQDFASELLAAISTQRQSEAEKQRPIIFICHSLGGLVFKQVRLRWKMWTLG